MDEKQKMMNAAKDVQKVANESGATGILPVGSAERVPTSALAGFQWHPMFVLFLKPQRLKLNVWQSPYGSSPKRSFQMATCLAT